MINAPGLSEPKYKLMFDWLHMVLSNRGPESTTRLVLVALWSHVKPPELKCWPTEITLAQETGLSERAVRDHLRAAEAAGWITRQLRRSPGSRWPHTVYQLQFPDIERQIDQAA